MSRVGVVMHPKRQAAIEAARELREAIEREGGTTVLLSDDGDSPEVGEVLDLVVSVGGDGTFLRAAYAAGAVLEGLWTVLGRSDEPRMTRFLAAQLGTSHFFDLAAARRYFGFEPLVSMAEGRRRLGKVLSRDASAKRR